MGNASGKEGQPKYPDIAEKLYSAVANGDIDSMKELISSGANPNMCLQQGYTSLILASGLGHIEIVNYLLSLESERQHTNSRSSTSQHQGQWNFGQRVKVNACMYNGCTALIVACEVGHIDVVRMLLKNGARVNQAQNNHRTALMQASQNGHIEMVQMLLESGAMVNAVDDVGMTSLHMACQYGHNEIARLLLCSGTDVNSCNMTVEHP